MQYEAISKHEQEIKLNPCEIEQTNAIPVRIESPEIKKRLQIQYIIKNNKQLCYWEITRKNHSEKSSASNLLPLSLAHHTPQTIYHLLLGLWHSMEVHQARWLRLWWHKNGHWRACLGPDLDHQEKNKEFHSSKALAHPILYTLEEALQSPHQECAIQQTLLHPFILAEVLQAVSGEQVEYINTHNLSPIWEISTSDGSILKTEDADFFLIWQPFPFTTVTQKPLTLGLSTLDFASGCLQQKSTPTPSLNSLAGGQGSTSKQKSAPGKQETKECSGEDSSSEDSSSEDSSSEESDSDNNGDREGHDNPKGQTSTSTMSFDTRQRRKRYGETLDETPLEKRVCMESYTTRARNALRQNGCARFRAACNQSLYIATVTDAANLISLSVRQPSEHFRQWVIELQQLNADNHQWALQIAGDSKLLERLLDSDTLFHYFGHELDKLIFYATGIQVSHWRVGLIQPETLSQQDKEMIQAIQCSRQCKMLSIAFIPPVPIEIHILHLESGVLEAWCSKELLDGINLLKASGDFLQYHHDLMQTSDDDTILELNTEIYHLRVAAESTLKSHKEIQQDLKTQLQKEENQHKQLKKEHEAQSQTWHSEANKWEIERHQLKQKLEAEHKKQQEEIDSKLHTLQQEQATLSSRYHTDRQAWKEEKRTLTQEAQKRCRSQKKAIDNISARIRGVFKEQMLELSTSKQRKIDDLTQKNRKATKTLKKLKKQLEEEQALHDSIVKQVTSIQEEKKQLQKKLDNLTKEYDKNLLLSEELREKAEDISTKCQQKKIQIDELRSKQTVLEEECMASERKWIKKKQKWDKEQQELSAALDKTKALLTEKTDQIALLQCERLVQDQSLSTEKEKLQALHSQLQTVQGTQKTETLQHEAARRTWAEEKEHWKQEKATLTQKIQAMDKELNLINQAAQKTKESFQKLCDNLQTEKSRATQKLQEAESYTTQLSEQLTQLRAKLHNKDQELEEHRKQSEEQLSSLGHLEESHAQLTKNLASLHNEKEQLGANHQSSRRAWATEKHQWEHEKTTLAQKFQATLNARDQKLEEHRKLSEEQLSSLRHLEETNAKMTKKLTSLDNEKKRLKAEKTTLYSQLQAKQTALETGESKHQAEKQAWDAEKQQREKEQATLIAKLSHAETLAAEQAGQLAQLRHDLDNERQKTDSAPHQVTNLSQDQHSEKEESVTGSIAGYSDYDESEGDDVTETFDHTVSENESEDDITDASGHYKNVSTDKRFNPYLEKLRKTKPSSSQYLRVVADYVLRNIRPWCTSARLNKIRQPMPDRAVTPFKSLRTWQSNHLNYLAWKYQDDIPDRKMSFNEEKKTLCNTLKLLKPGHQDYDTLMFLYLKKMLRIENKKTVIYNREDKDRFCRFGNQIKVVGLELPTKFKQRHHVHEWGSETFRLFLQDHGIKFRDGEVCIPKH